MMDRAPHRLLHAFVLLTLFTMSCAGSETAAPVRAEPPPTSSPEPSLSDDQSDASAPLAAPTAPAPTAPAPVGPSAQTVVLQEANPRVTGVVYPRPDYDGDPWSQWGQGVVLPDGRVISAIGDHLGRGGNSFIFVFDPATGVMTRVADVADSLSHPAESWGFGKVHGQMVLGEDGDVYFSTYWGHVGALSSTTPIRATCSSA